MTRIRSLEGIEDLYDLSEICRKAEEPIFLTKSGEGVMAVMSIKVYDRLLEQASRETIRT